MSASNIQFLPLVDEGADVITRLADWLSTATGDLDATNAAALANVMYAGDAAKIAAFQTLLADAWNKQKNMTQQVTVMVGI